MKRFVCLVFLIQCSIIFGQEPLVTVKDFNRYDLNIIADTPHLFVDDSVYVVSGSSVQAYASDRYSKKDIIQVKDSIFKHSGGGSVYKMDTTFNFDRIIYKPKMEQSFFQSSNFVRNDTILQYGGYGNFSHKNSLIFLDANLKSWEFYPYSTQNLVKPPMGSPQFTTYFNDSLWVLGFYVASNEGTQSNNELIREIWEFSFKTRKWTKKGSYDFSDRFNGLVRKYFKVGNSYYARSSFNNTLVVDLEKMIWTEYEDLTSINTKFRGINRTRDYYYVLNQTSGNSLELIRIREGDLLGQKLNEGRIILNEQNNILNYILIGVVILILPVLFRTFFTKPSTKSKIIEFKTKKALLLSKDEIRLLEDLLKVYPKGVSFKTIGAYFDKGLNFETIKVKTRKLIYQLNEKIAKETKITAALEIRKSVEDKRAREVFIKD